jgi:hypothetical protein
MRSLRRSVHSVTVTAAHAVFAEKKAHKISACSASSAVPVALCRRESYVSPRSRLDSTLHNA